MIDESRIGIYNYVYGLLYGTVSENVYSMNEPQELTDSDTQDGFIRGRLDKAKYKTFEDGINTVINAEIDNGTNEHYTIESDGILSMDSNKDTNANNAYYMFVKSFIVTIN